MLKVDQWLAFCVPRRCVLCHQASGSGCICAGCHDDLPWLGPVCLYCALPLPVGMSPGACGACARYDFNSGRRRPQLHAALAYEYPVDRLVTGVKFHRQLHFARALGELLAGVLAGVLAKGSSGAVAGNLAGIPVASQRPDLLLPMPLHRRRLAERGYNQAHEIARPVAQSLGMRMVTGLCERTRHTPEQSGLNANERRRNLRQAFAVRGDCAGASVAVVDDVITTGSTAAAVAQELYAAGAAHVQVWAAARTL